MKKKLMAVLLCVVMLVGLLPVTALAAETDISIQLTSNERLGVPVESSGTGWEYDRETSTLTIRSGYRLAELWAYMGSEKEAGVLSAARCINYGTIDIDKGNIYLSDSLINQSGGEIRSGGFYASVSNEAGGVISGWDFYRTVTNKGTINGGTFSEIVTNEGTINNGRFNGAVVNSGTGDDARGVIQGGIFTSALTNGDEKTSGGYTGQITGGYFTGSLTNQRRGTISGGHFLISGIVNSGYLFPGIQYQPPHSLSLESNNAEAALVNPTEPYKEYLGKGTGFEGVGYTLPNSANLIGLYLNQEPKKNGEGLYYIDTASFRSILGASYEFTMPAADSVVYAVYAVPVTDISEPSIMTVAANTDLTLSSTVLPANAAYRQIEWSLKEANGTGAAVEGGVFRATAEGTATVTATIQNGTSVGTAYTEDFTITVSDTSPAPAPDGVQTELDISKGSITIGDGSVSGYGSDGNAVAAHDPDGYKIIDSKNTTTGNTVTVNGGTHSITLEGISISNDSSPFSIRSGATVNLSLAGSNSLRSYSMEGAGLQVPGGATLTINGSGSLEATGGFGGAGIGGNVGGDVGTVIIKGGTVTATGSSDGGAGIGGGVGGDGGTVTIEGGTVTAASIVGGAGIGGGDSNHGGTVIIKGGTVTATGSSDGGAGIGGGVMGDGGTVNIEGGTVTATGNGGGAGIGSGSYSGGSNVTITGGTVTATGDEGGGAGIGGGSNGSYGGTVTITGGNVKATCLSGGAGIGGGSYGSYGGMVTITGGNVKATCLSGGADIGAGAGGGSSNGKLQNANGDNVYLTTLTLDGESAATPIASLNATGLSSAYGMKDVKTIDTNKLYLYLPENTTIHSITTGETPVRLFTNQSGTAITVADNQNNTGTLTLVAASIADVTVSGAPNRALASASTTFTLTREKFKELSANADVSAWFTNLPAGLTAKLSAAVAENATTAEVTFSGTPTAVVTATITAEIPAAAIVGGVALSVTENANAKWDIVTPTVTSVMVNPASVSIEKGGSQTFNAMVVGKNDPAQTVTWSVEGNTAGTNIRSDGVLTIVENETAKTLTVRATSTVDPSKSGTATVTVTTPASSVTSVWVNPASVSIQKGGSQTFTATVTGENNPAKTVTWSVEGGTADTAIDENGRLTIVENETANTLTVRATSTADSTKSGTATVTVTTPPTPPAPDPIQYAILKGKNSEWTKGSGNGLGITVDANYSKFTSVSVNGETISSDKYTAQSGSTIVTLKASYLKTLSVGRHTLRVNFTDGYAETNFTIKAATNPDIPATGDSAQTVLWLGIALLAGIGLAATLFVQRKRKR